MKICFIDVSKETKPTSCYMSITKHISMGVHQVTSGPLDICRLKKNLPQPVSIINSVFPHGNYVCLYQPVSK